MICARRNRRESKKTQSQTSEHHEPKRARLFELPLLVDETRVVRPADNQIARHCIKVAAIDTGVLSQRHPHQRCMPYERAKPCCGPRSQLFYRPTGPIQNSNQFFLPMKARDEFSFFERHSQTIYGMQGRRVIPRQWATLDLNTLSLSLHKNHFARECFPAATGVVIGEYLRFLKRPV